jgi:hypothetical protein
MNSTLDPLNVGRIGADGFGEPVLAPFAAQADYIRRDILTDLVISHHG